MNRLDFPKMDVTGVEVSPKHFPTTRTLLKNFVEQAFSTAKNVNIYSNGHRVYIFQGKWKLVSTSVLPHWASAVSENFVEWLQTKKSLVCGLARGKRYWSRIETLYLQGEQRMKYYAKTKNKEQHFNAAAILRDVSDQNAQLRIRRVMGNRMGNGK